MRKASITLILVCYSKIVGDSVIGKEIAEKIQPDFVVVPTNNGTLFAGVWKGLKGSKATPVMVAATAKNTDVADSIGAFTGSKSQRFQTPWRNRKESS